MTNGFETSTLIAQSPDAVWAIMTDLERAPDWMPGVEKVEPLDDAPLAEGKVFATELSTGGRGRRREMTLVRWDPEDRAFALSSTEGSLTAVYHYALAPAGCETRATLRARCDGGGLAIRLMWPLIRYMMARHDSRHMPMLKALAEGAARH